MSAAESILSLTRVEGGRTFLASPGVGTFSCALREGALVTAGQALGVLTTLGVERRLVVPDDIHGVVAAAPASRTRAPVGYADVLIELRPLESAAHAASARNEARAKAPDQLTVRSPQSGRFYHRGAPGEVSLCEVGRELEVGTPIGLIEVMKTFTQVVYRAEHGLPARARIASVLAKDGGDIGEGEILLVVEPCAHSAAVR